MSKLLSLAEILDCDDLEDQIVEVPQWGGSIKIRSFTKAAQQDMREAARIAGEIDTARLEVAMLAYGMIEPQVTMSQAESLRQKNATAFDLVLHAITELNHITEKAVGDAIDRFPG